MEEIAIQVDAATSRGRRIGIFSMLIRHAIPLTQCAQAVLEE